MNANAGWLEALWAWYTLWAVGIHGRAFYRAVADRAAARAQHIDGEIDDLGTTRILYTFALTAAQLCFFIPGAISLFLPPSPRVDIQVGGAVAVLGLLFGELILGFASFADQWRRERVRGKP